MVYANSVYTACTCQRSRVYVYAYDRSERRSARAGAGRPRAARGPERGESRDPGCRRELNPSKKVCTNVTVLRSSMHTRTQTRGYTELAARDRSADQTRARPRTHATRRHLCASRASHAAAHTHAGGPPPPPHVTCRTPAALRHRWATHARRLRRLTASSRGARPASTPPPPGSRAPPCPAASRRRRP